MSEPMEDLISRQAAIDALGHMCSEDEDGITVSRANVNSMLKALPSAQQEPIKINIEDFNKEDWERLKKEWENSR